MMSKEYMKGNDHAVKHGGAVAIQALSKGKPFTGLAADAQKEVEADLEMNGQPSLLVENAVRTQAVLRLYWNAINKAMEDGDLALLDHYTARFGWLVGVAMRAWDVAAKHSPDKRPTNVIDLLRGGDNDSQD